MFLYELKLMLLYELKLMLLYELKLNIEKHQKRSPAHTKNIRPWRFTVANNSIFQTIASSNL